MKLTKENKESIKRLCLVGLRTLKEQDGVNDAFALKKFIDTVFIEIEEREYAYNYLSSYLKEKVDEGNSDQR